MAWVSLILAGLFEMFGVAMINKLHKDRNWQSLCCYSSDLEQVSYFLLTPCKPCRWGQLMLSGQGLAHQEER